jgi:hypothetical protein
LRIRRLYSRRSAVAGGTVPRSPAPSKSVTGSDSRATAKFALPESRAETYFFVTNARASSRSLRQRTRGRLMPEFGLLERPVWLIKVFDNLNGSEPSRVIQVRLAGGDAVADEAQRCLDMDGAQRVEVMRVDAASGTI